jgi:putative transposase
LEKVAMTNYKRLKIDGAVYFFTLVLNDRIGSNLLIAEFNQLKESIKKVKASYPFKLNAMVVLPDHLHMIMSLPKNDTDYSVRIRLIKTTSQNLLIKPKQFPLQENQKKSGEFGKGDIGNM